MISQASYCDVVADVAASVGFIDKYLTRGIVAALRCIRNSFARASGRTLLIEGRIRIGVSGAIESVTLS